MQPTSIFRQLSVSYSTKNQLTASHKGEKNSFTLNVTSHASYLYSFASHYYSGDGIFHEVTGLVACTALLFPMPGKPKYINFKVM